MGLFDEQLKARKENDREALQRSLWQLGAAVTGRTSSSINYHMADDAVQEIFNWFEVKPPEPPSLMAGFEERLNYMLNPTGILRRTVKLTGMWWKDASGPMLAFTTAGEAVALFPRRFGGYGWIDRKMGHAVKAGAKTSGYLTGEAICFYRPFPLRTLTLKDLGFFSLKSLDGWSLMLFALTGLLASLLGMVTPMLTRLIFGTVIPSGNSANIVPAAILALGTILSISLIGTTKSLAMARISQKLRVSVENAAMGRLLHLPARFFKNHNAGELQNRINSLSQMCALLGDTVFTSVVSGIFSVVYLFQLAVMTPALAAPAAGILLVQILVMIAGILLQAHVTRKRLGIAAELNGLVFRLFSGIQKIKLAGAEHRAFAKWAETYAKDAALLYNPPLLLRIQPALSGLITLGGSILLYAAVAHASIDASDYMAFSSAYGLVSGAMISLSMATGSIANLKPLAELAAPIMKETPETGSGKKALTRMSGSVEFSQVSFRYTEDSPWILGHISLKIRPGQYIAIVGKTGCGKSTLMRLLLGFETPVSGAVYYDNRDLQTLDLQSVRRNIGVVLQNSRLFTGDIYSNIVISAPWLTLSDAWEAAKMAGVDEDIRKMPMGMQTMISEGGGGISGGQRQRIMIARAIAPKPKLLMFDEATSALDNITQRVVSDSLNGLNCTRIVIAHRLSTIRQCDRILVLDKGKIVEDGNFNELLAADGFFAELVKRQTLEPAK
ncbi:NHLP bacteriocin export ABC transporter permease/ATPase subunit [Enterocloster aldenensis]|uniref:NHLP bacteriocin export ABC transporter permease/ATPase subunit n=1 Tax=Enterocloster aldenensis TaxID=358742 RepID=UPI000E4BC865|nr:NHLP bacteriocin export ABC transporter permease/ATPase subunit [Enterocloster aldenensis]